MKKISFKLLFTCHAVLLSPLLAGNAWAAIYTNYWDNNGVSAATSGTWDTTTKNWDLNSTLTASTVAFTNGNYALFAGGSTTISALTITVPGAVSCDGLGDGTTSTGGASGAPVTTLTLSGAGSISLPTGTWPFECGNASPAPTIIINVSITGAGGIIQHNDGALSLGGNNTYAGGTFLTGDQVINYSNTNSFGTGPISVGGSGNALVSGASSALLITNAFTFPTANYVLNLAGGNPVSGAPGTTFSGAFGLPSSGLTTLETSSTATEVTEISGGIGGASGLIVSDSGTLELGGTNTYTGSTTISSPATLSFVSSSTLGSGSYSGLITNNSVLIYNSSAYQTLAGVISGSGKLTNNGTGKLTLSAINTYTNVTVVNGGSGCTLQLGDGVSKSGTVGGAIMVTNSASLILAPGGSSVTYNGALQVISGSGTVTMNGPKTFIIGGNHNTYTGGTIINGGTLQTGGDSTSSGAAANLGISPATFQPANITLNGGTLQGNNPNFALVPNRGITLTANSGLSALVEGISALPDQGELGIQGPITDNNAGYGITITGQTNFASGFLSGVYLEGTNTYTGPTVITSGMLSLYYNGSINLSSGINLADDAVFDVSSNNANPWNLNQPLTANGNGDGLPGFYTLAPTPAAIFVGASGGTINFGSRALNLTITPTSFTGDGDQPALYVSQGSLILNGNTVSVTNNGASSLGYGTYTLIQQAAGSMTVLSAPTLAGGTVYGNGITAGATVSLVVSGGALNLVVAPNTPSTPYFSNLSPAPLGGFAYGSATSITLSGTVSNLSGGIAISGDTITAQVGGFGAQSATIGANGSFSISYSLPAYTAAGYYPIAYTYSGTLGSASDSSTALEISPALLSVLYADPSRNYNGSAAASVGLAPSPLNGDTVYINSSITPFGSTNFASPNPGANITVTITGLFLTGPQATNYYLPSTYTLQAAIYSPAFTWNGLDEATNPVGGSGGQFQWIDQYNWTNDIFPDAIGDSLDFGSTNVLSVVQSSYTNWSLTFDPTAGAFVITNLGSGGALLGIGAGGISNDSTNPQTFALPVNSLTSYSAQWYVTNGSSLIMSSNVSDIGGGITLAGTGLLDFAGSTNLVTGPFTNLAGTIEITGGARLNNGSYAGAINNSGTFLFNSAVSQTLSGIISGSGTFTLVAGVVTLSGASTYTGQTVVSNGSLVISKDSNLGAPPATPVANQLMLNNFINNGANDFGLRDTGGNFTLNTNRGIYLGPNGGSINVQSSFTLTVGGVISGPGNFYASPTYSAGYGTIVLATNNTYQGATYVGAGVLELGANGALPMGTPLTVNQADLGGVAATLNMNGFSQTIGPLQSAQFGGTGVLLPTIDLTGALTVFQTNATTTFSGVMSGSGGSLIITAPNGGVPGTLILSGTNTYTGGTIINAGTLALSTLGSINNSAHLSIAAGGTFDVSALTASTFNLSASTVLSAAGTGATVGTTAAAINGTSSGTVNLGSQPISLAYTPSAWSGDAGHPALYISQGTLQLNNNAITVTNASGQPLGAGTYTIIQQATGSVSGSPNPVITVTGNGVVAGATNSISVSGGSVNLVVTLGTAPTPVINSVMNVNGSLVLSGTNGLDSGTYIVLTSTNLTLPLNQWTPVATNTFSGTGTFSVTNNITGSQSFFIIETPE